jgi:hypothetical protein
MIFKYIIYFLVIYPSVLLGSEYSHIRGVELLVTDSGSAIESRFGHSLIRLIDNDDLWTNDLVISFAANVGDETTSLLKGVTGGYKVFPEIKTMYDFWNQYTFNEKRGFLRYPLRLSKLELHTFLDSLQAFIDDPNLAGDYKFFTNNCSTIVTKVFNHAELVKSKNVHNIPITIENWINENLYSPFLPIQTKAFNEPIKDDVISFEDLDNDYLAYSYLYGDYSFDFLQKLLKELKLRNIKLNDLYGLNQLPISFYNLDDDITEEDTHYSFEKLKELSKRRFLLVFSNSSFDEAPRYFKQEILLASQKIRNIEYKKSKIEVSNNKIKWEIYEHKSTVGTQHIIELSGLDLNKQELFQTRYNKFLELENKNNLIVIRDKDVIKLFLLR